MHVPGRSESESTPISPDSEATETALCPETAVRRLTRVHFAFGFPLSPFTIICQSNCPNMDRETVELPPSNIPSISTQSASDTETDSGLNSARQIPTLARLTNDLRLEDESSEIGTPSEYSELPDNLYSYTLNQLSLEPSRISGLRSQLFQQQEELILSNYTSLIDTSDCLDDIATGVESLLQPTEQISTSVGSFCDSIANFSEQAQVTCKKWKDSSKLLTKHSTLVELLEVPMLIETTINNGSDDESLKLHLYMKKLSTSKYLNNISILKHLTNQCEDLIARLASKLLRDLRTKLELAQCLKIVSLLRKLDLFTETEIRVKFLTARDAWFQSLLNEIPTSPPLLHLSRLTELARINLFDIATQYQAAFTSPSITSSSSTQSSLLHSSEVSNVRILSSWLMYKVEMIINYINKDLNGALASDPPGPVESVKDNILYFGQSMSRIGMELRPRLICILSSALKEKAKKDPPPEPSLVTPLTVELEDITEITTNGSQDETEEEEKKETPRISPTIESSITASDGQEQQVLPIIVVEDVQEGPAELPVETSEVTLESPLNTS